MNVKPLFRGRIELKAFLFKSLTCFVVTAGILIGSVIVCSAEESADSALIRDIENNLIAPCCWTQPISEHESAVSEEMRQKVQDMVASGMSRNAILDYFVAQYGERILATPRAEGFNRLVYILPWFALIAGAAVLFILLKKLRAPVPDLPSKPLPDSRYASVIEKELQDLEEQ